jgi:hypothetical protein
MSAAVSLWRCIIFLASVTTTAVHIKHLCSIEVGSKACERLGMACRNNCIVRFRTRVRVFCLILVIACRCLVPICTGHLRAILFSDIMMPFLRTRRAAKELKSSDLENQTREIWFQPTKLASIIAAGCTDTS